MTRRPRVMLVGPWKWTTGGVTTFMNNVMGSALGEQYEFIRFNIARPPKRNVANNYGYGAIWRGGIGRVILGVLVTFYHVAIFPLVLMIRRPDVVQVQSSDFQVFWEASIYVCMARVLRIPVLMRLGGAFDHFYDVSSPSSRAMIRRVLQWPDRLIVQSIYWRELIAGLGRREGVVVLSNSVPESLTELSGFSKDEPPICFFAAGSEAVRKGLDDILEAMQILHDEGVRPRFHIVAGNKELRDRLAASAIAQYVVVDGVLPHDRIIKAMRAADIFLLPSRAEGFPNALVEAMALGLAPVVTPVGAIPEIVENTGAIVVPVHDAKALAGAIAQLATQPALRSKIGTAAREAVKARYVHCVTAPILDRAWRSLSR